LARIHQKGPKNIREEILTDSVNLFHNYRAQCAPNSSPSQLVIPETLKLMPVYMLSAMKTHAFRLLSNSRQLDSKLYWIQKFLSIPFGKVPYLFYPRMYCVTDILNAVGRQETGGEDQGDGQALDWGYFTDESGQTMAKPRILAGRLEKVTKQDAYVMDNGEYINLLIQSQVPDQFV